MTRFALSACLSAVLAAVQMAASAYGVEYGRIGAPMPGFIDADSLTQKLVHDHVFDDAPAAPSSAEALVFRAGPPSGMAQTLARSYPPQARAEVVRVFGELLHGYEEVAGRFAIPRHDLAGAVAAFIAGSYMGYHNADFPDANFPPLVRQVRAILAAQPAIAQAPDADKQAMYEQLAVLGMFMAATQMALKQQPDPQVEARMRQSARGYLETFLDTDAERVQITAQGLVLR